MRRYDTFTAHERLRTLEWLCSWSRVSSLYYDILLPKIKPTESSSKRLAGMHGNRRVRTPLYGGERVGW